MSIADEIESLSAQRRALWEDGNDTAGCHALTEQIDALYEQKRRDASPHGTPAQHERAVQRGKAEEELDRLMQP